jgi:hypothetical protein
MTFDRPLRSIFTFVQLSTPTGAVPGDTWYQPGYQRAWQWDGTQWIVFEVVSDPQPAGWVGIAGYTCGGFNVGQMSSCEKLSFRNDTCQLLASNLGTGRYSSFGFASYAAGYSGGGYSSGYPTSAQRLLFSDDTISGLVSVLNVARFEAGSFESGIKGYACGGLASDGVSGLSSIQGLLFSSESMALLAANIGVARSYICCGFSSVVAGFVPGGVGYTTRVDKLTFATEGTSTLLSGLTLAKGHSAGFSSNISGYDAAGSNGGYLSSIDKLLFSTELIYALLSTVSSAVQDPGGFQSRINGYVMGGLNPGYHANIEKIDFTSDTVASLSYTLVSARSNNIGSFENLAR